MKKFHFILVIMCTLLLSCESSAEQKLVLSQLNKHVKHWQENETSFNELVDVFRKIDKKVHSLRLVKNESNGFELMSEPKIDISTPIRNKIINLSRTLNIYQININNTPDRIGFIGRSDIIGDDYKTTVTINSSYIYIIDKNYNIPASAFCDVSKQPELGKPICFVKLSSGWFMEHAVHLPD